MENLTVVIPFYNGHPYIDRLVRSIPQDLPVVIVDDCSDEPLYNHWTVNNLSEGSVKVIRLKNKKYFSGAVNRGIQECNTDVLVLNQDVWFENQHWLSLLESHRSHFGMIGERIVGTHPAFGDLGYIHGTFMFLRRNTIETVGLLDQQKYPLWGSTAEYQWRVARKNFRVLPLKEIPGMKHERKSTERYGNSIKQILKQEPQKQDLLVRTPPLLSIIVPCYNYGRYLQDCINSLIGGNTSLGMMPGQTLQSFEVIVVDDASTDDSAEYIKKIVSEEKGIRAYHLEKNVGTAIALNFGIDKAVGKYITFLSADDMRESDSLEKLVEVCEQNPHSFAYDDVWLVNRHQRVKKWEMQDYDFEKLIWKNQVHAGIVFPKEAWKDVGGYPPIMGDGREDWAFNVALGIRGWCGIHVKQFGYLYRREGQNRTERNTTEEHRKNFLRKIMDLFPDIYRGERPVACCGKGSSKISTNGKVSALSLMSLGGSARMARSVGSQGMVKIEYLGSQVMFTISGDVTDLPYTFGKDRPRGYVDKRDVGSKEEKTGFLSKKDRNTGQYLYRLAEKDSSTATSEPVVATQVRQESNLVVAEERGAVATSEAVGTLSAEKKIDFPNPDDLNVEEIKRLELTKEQWQAVYKAEMAGRNRKGATGFIEEKLAELEA